MRRLDNWDPWGAGPRQFGSIVSGVFTSVLAKHSRVVRAWCLNRNRTRTRSRDDQIFDTLAAGINAGQHEGGGKSLEIRRFGFNLDHGGVNGGLKVLVDDVQQNQSSLGHGQGYLGALKTLTPELVDDVATSGKCLTGQSEIGWIPQPIALRPVFQFHVLPARSSQRRRNPATRLAPAAGHRRPR